MANSALTLPPSPQLYNPPMAVAAPFSVVSGTPWVSGPIASNGYKSLAVGITSSAAGTMTMQRYLDPGGTIAIGAMASVTLGVNSPTTMVSPDATPFSSFVLTITITSGSASITGFGVLLS